MNTFKELCKGKVWRAVEGMIIGLEEQNARPDFKVRMWSFGNVDLFDRFCFGCAATCTIQKLSGVNFTVGSGVGIDRSDLRSRILNVDHNDLRIFEETIDFFRRGIVERLFKYMGVKIPVDSYRYTDALIRLEENWAENLKPYRDLLSYLKENDI